MSGYVLGMAYALKIENNDLTGWNFMKLRVARLYPAYAFSVLPAALAMIAVQHFPHPFHIASLFDILRSSMLAFFFIPSVFSDSLHGWGLNHPWWSLFYELVIGAMLYLVISEKIKIKIEFITLLFGFSLILISIHHLSIERGWQLTLKEISEGFLRSGYGIMFGYLLYLKKETLIKFIPKHLSPLPAMVLVLLVFCSSWQGWLGFIIQIIAITLIFPLSILILAHSEESNSRIISFMQWLGDISYPLYVIHMPLIMLTVAILPKELMHTKPWGSLLLAALLLVIADFIHRWIDLPGRSLMKSLIFRTK
jgi:peptidoglycan/LPS O-acetylase OafA/YrhL